MSTRFGRAMERLHKVGAERLSDSVGDYHAIGRAPVRGLQLAIHRDLREAGAEEIMLAGAVLIELNISELCAVERGGVFAVGARRYVVERPVSDDGHRLTVLCMEAP